MMYIKSAEDTLLDAKISSDLLRGHTDTIVLNILNDGDSYGYEIFKKIVERSEGLYELKEATLYSSYRRLELEGSITSYWGDETLGGRRKYYRITASGKRILEQNKLDWAFTKQIIDKLL